MSAEQPGFLTECRSTGTPVLEVRMEAAEPVGSDWVVPEELETTRREAGYAFRRDWNFAWWRWKEGERVRLGWGKSKGACVHQGGGSCTSYSGHTVFVFGFAKQLSLSSTTALMSACSPFSDWGKTLDTGTGSWLKFGMVA